MLNNIPIELRERAQWVFAGENKAPMNARTGKLASVIDPSTWSTFEEAVATGKPPGYVIIKSDDFSFIDLDAPLSDEQKARHSSILKAVHSYAELSISKTGVHIIVKGKIPHGIKKDRTELYSDKRYMICTGNRINNFPITDQQPILDALYRQMHSTSEVDLVDEEEILTDEEIYDMGARASNSEKFIKLFKGDWQSDYPSQSEADLALLTIIAFYTRNNDQVRRVFRYSQLGQRDKAKRDKYLNYALRKIRAKQRPLIDISALLENAEKTAEVNNDKPCGVQDVDCSAVGVGDAQVLPTPETLVTKPTQVGEHATDKQSDHSKALLTCVTFPKGLVGEIATYIYQSAIRPVPEIALAGAIALVAGIAGRSYNVSGMGLNQYIILLAKTGCGKEGAAKGIDSLITACSRHIPMANDFIGAGVFASGQALIKQFDKRPCFVSVLGEFGLTLQQICDPHAHSALVMLKRALLDLYSKSGSDRILQPSVYSDHDKNTGLIRAPNITILGESTHETFYSKLSASHIAEGLIPRFLVVNYEGKRPPKNPNAFFAPSEQLIASLCELLSICLAADQNNTCVNVPSTVEANTLLDKFDRYADNKINTAGSDIDVQLWNRSHLKAIKLSALVAVGVSVHNPIVDIEIARWSLDLIVRDVNAMAERFSLNIVGQGEHTYESHVRGWVDDYFQLSREQKLNYRCPVSIVDQAIIPWQYLRRRSKNTAALQNDKRGLTTTLKILLDDLAEADILIQLDITQTIKLTRQRSKLYVKGLNY